MRSCTAPLRCYHVARLRARVLQQWDELSSVDFVGSSKQTVSLRYPEVQLYLNEERFDNYRVPLLEQVRC